MGFAGIVSFYRLRPQNAFPARSSGIFIHPLAPEFLGFTVPALPPAFLALPSFPSLFPFHSHLFFPDPSRAFLGRFQTRAPSPRHWDDSQLTQLLPRALFLGLHPTFPVQKHPGRRKNTAPAPRRRRWKFVIPRDFSQE